MSAGLGEGAVFAGRYRVVRCIAAGGMGAVYEVVHIETERRRALKVMLPHILQNADLRERFQREAKVAAHVESDFIVDVFDAGYDESTRMPYLVMELLRGEELGQRLKRIGRLAPGDVVTYLHQTALALDKTHRANIVHRDLKPENLFLTERDDGPPRIKVLDFGIAKVVAESTTMGGGTQSIGTPTYMAPEQLNPNARLTGAADRYALAMVAYTLLVGAPYWGEEARAGNILALAMVTVYGPREPASARAARCGVSLPPAFDAWFARAAHVDPAQRFGTAAEMIGALAEALGQMSPVRPIMPSMSSSEPAPLAQSIELPTVPTPVSAPTYNGTRFVAPVAAPITAPATTGPTSPRTKGPVLAIVGGALAIALAAAGVLAIGGTRRAPAGSPASASVSADQPATAVTASPTASAAPAVTAEPSVVPSEEPAPAASAAPSTTASAQGKVEPASTSSPATSKAAGTARPAASTPAPVDPKRKKMWGRD